MEKREITEANLLKFAQYLRSAEHSKGTVAKYLRDVQSFAEWLKNEPATKENLASWKANLQQNYAAVTVNSMLAAVHRFFKFLGWNELHVKYLHIQRRLFRERSRELTRSEYDRLLETAQNQGKTRLALLMETICSTGIRVSEVQYITVEAARNCKVEITLKGKIRTVLLPGKLCRKLLKYAGKKKIASGKIFLTESGKALNRRQIWSELKRLCKHAKVEESKVFPHNLRHLFATVFYKACKDIAKLADLLGHSSIETTRIYLLTSGEEHARQLNKLGLVT